MNDTGEYRYGAFVSYRHTEPDRRWARWLHSALETYKTPESLVAGGAAKRIGRVFRDEDELPASADLSREIESALKDSRFLIVVCSANTPDSRWINQEVVRFRELGRQDNILALLVDGEPQDAFPAALYEIRRPHDDGEPVKSEPLAADVRAIRWPSKWQRRRLALLRLLAPMLGCRFDDLRQREQERRIRRLGFLSAVLAVLVIGIAALALFAWQQKLTADAERTTAVARQLAAQARLLPAQRHALVETGLLLAVESMRREPLFENDRIIRKNSALLTKELHRLDHPEYVRMARFSPDGRYLATAAEKSVRIWDTSNGALVRTLSHSAEVRGVYFTQDGNQLLTTGTFRGVGVWNVSDGEFALPLPHDGSLLAIALSRDGRFVATSWEGGAKIWSVADWRLVAELPHAETVFAVAFSADGESVATGSIDNLARVWDVASGDELVSIAHQDRVTAAGFSPDGRYLATGGHDGTVRLTRVDTWEEAGRLLVGEWIQDLAFSPGSDYVAVAGFGGTVRIWPLAEPEQGMTLFHQGPVRRVTVSPDGRFVATVSDDFTARLWETTTGREVTRLVHTDEAIDVAFDRSGALIATAGADGSSSIWAMPDLGPPLVPHERRVARVRAFSADGRLFVWENDGALELVNAATRQRLARLNVPSTTHVVEFSENGQFVAAYARTGGLGGSVTVWDTLSGTSIFENDIREAECVRLSDDGGLIAVCGESVRVWSTASGNRISTLKGGEETWFFGVGFSADGRLVAAGSEDGTAYVWELETGAQIASLKHPQTVHSLSFSRDGRRLLTETGDIIGPEGAAYVWDIATESSLSVHRHQANLISLTLNRDGSLAAAGSNNGTVRVWDAVTGAELMRMSHPGYVISVAFGENEQTLLTGSSEGTVRLHRLGPADALIRDACDRLRFNLSRAEWEQYLPGEPYRSTCPGLPMREDKRRPAD